MLDPTKDPRCGGIVARYHTWPTIQQQTVAEHSWQVARILLAIWPQVPVHIIREALFHDIGEVRTGDLPFPLKRDNPALKREMDRLETDARFAMCLPWGVPPVAPLHEDEHRVLKLCDMIEMWEFGLQEKMLGSKFSEPIVVKTGLWISVELEDLLRKGREVIGPGGRIGSWLVGIAERAKDYTEKRVREWTR